MAKFVIVNPGILILELSVFLLFQGYSYEDTGRLLARYNDG
jgi:hypothetical protein